MSDKEEKPEVFLPELVGAKEKPDESGINIGAKHLLIVLDEYDEDNPEDSLILVHPDSCPVEEVDWGDNVKVQRHNCDVTNEVEMVGLQGFFVHQDAPEDRRHHAERLSPGRYEIIAWYEYYAGGPWGGPDATSGLALVALEEDESDKWEVSDDGTE